MVSFWFLIDVVVKPILFVYTVIIFVYLEAQEKLKKYREDNERKSKEVLELWDSSVKHKIKQLGNDRKCYLIIIAVKK